MRYRADGNLEFLGRSDHQVKLRGFRIELGEIEATLARHPDVREALVAAREDTPGEVRLVAYVVQGSGVRGQGSEDAVLIPDPRSLIPELRGFLKQQLPDYMLPSAFVLLEALPLLPSGKVDRRALPPPQTDRPDADSRSALPRTPLEQVLVQLWATVLKLEQLGRDDDFFALGGHSLLATQLIARIWETFEVELPVRSLFEAPTVARLAERVERARSKTPELRPPPLVPLPRSDALPLSFAQQRLWFIDRLTPGTLAYNVPAALRLSGPLDVAALRASLSAIVARHESLRTTFAMRDGQPLQLIAPARPLALRLLDLQTLPQDQREAAARRLANAEALHPFDLSRGPLLRTTLLRLGREEHVVLLTMHHIVSDGWSMGVFIKEIAEFYSAFSQGRRAALPALPIQYADFAVWQRAWLQGEVLEAQLNYWKDQLTGAPPLLELPSDHPRPAVQTFHGARQPIALPAALAEPLNTLSRQEGVTLFMTLLAAFAVLLSRYSGQEDVVVGTDIANRTRVEVEPLIGFFINQLALRTKLSGNPTFREVLGQVREVVLDAYAHQDLPFDKLVEVLRPQRSLSYTPLFQVKLILQNAPMSALELEHLTLSPLRIEERGAGFDLIVSLAEGGQGLQGTVEYNTDLFEAATITRLIGHFEALLGAIVAQPDARLSRLEIHSAAEAQQQALDSQERKAAKRRKFRSVERKAVPVQEDESKT